MADQQQDALVPSVVPTTYALARTELSVLRLYIAADGQRARIEQCAILPLNAADIPAVIEFLRLVLANEHSSHRQSDERLVLEYDPTFTETHRIQIATRGRKRNIGISLSLESARIMHAALTGEIQAARLARVQAREDETL